MKWKQNLNFAIVYGELLWLSQRSLRSFWFVFSMVYRVIDRTVGFRMNDWKTKHTSVVQVCLFKESDEWAIKIRRNLLQQVMTDDWRRDLGKNFFRLDIQHLGNYLFLASSMVTLCNQSNSTKIQCGLSLYHSWYIALLRLCFLHCQYDFEYNVVISLGSTIFWCRNCT